MRFPQIRIFPAVFNIKNKKGHNEISSLQPWAVFLATVIIKYTTAQKFKHNQHDDQINDIIKTAMMIAKQSA